MQAARGVGQSSGLSGDRAIRCLSSLSHGICRSGTGTELGDGGTTGRSGFDRGRGRSLFRLIVGNQRIGVGHVDAAFIAADVVDDRIVAGELGQMQGLGTEVGQGRGVAEADFDVFFHAEAALFALTEEQRLGFNPTHRGGELPGEQFGQEQTAELLVVIGVGIPHGRVVERGLDTLGRHDFEDLGGEFLGHLERGGHQVRDVAVHQTATVVDVSGKQRVELVAEFRHALAQQCGVERHIDAGHQHERGLATECGHAAGGIGLQSLESGDRTGDGVLLAGEVVVHDLQEFAGRLGHGFHVFLDVRVVHTELVRAQGTHAVVGATLCVTLDEVVHGGTTVEHELQHGFQRNHVGERGQRVVFAERVAGEVCRPDIGAGFAQTGGLGKSNRRERHLRELRQVEQAFGVTVGHAVGGELLRVIAHEAQDREAELGAGELVGALPHVAGGGGLGTLVQNHALLLDALAGVDEGGARCADQCGAAGDELAVDTAGDFEGHAAVAHLADALDGDFDGVVKLNHAVHVVGPAGNLVVGTLLVQRLHGVLGGGGQPHAVHKRSGQTGDASATSGGVDRVEVAGSAGEGGHVVWGDDLHAAQQTARRGRDLLVLGVAELGGVCRQSIGVDAAADRETLGFAGKQRAVGSGVGHVDGDHAAGGGLEVILSPRLQGDGFTGVLKQVLLVHLKFDEVVEVDGVEQAFNHRVALDVHGAERRVNRRPGRADQRIGGDAAGLQGGRQSGASGRFVVEAEVGGQGVGCGCGTERTLVRGLVVKLRHLGELVAGDGGVADACGGGEHRVDVRNQAFAVHDRHTAGLGAFHDERDDDIAHGVLGGAAVRVVVPVGVEVDVQIVLAGRGVKRADLVVLVAQGGAVGGVVGDVADPGDVRGLADEVLGAGGLAECGEIVVLSGIGGLLFVLHALDGGGFEAAEDVGDRLVDGGDAGHGDRAGDGTHGIGGVALVFGLPELVLTPPTQQVVVDDGYERHGLGVFAHEHREPSHVGRDHLEFGGLRVGQCELFERGGRVGENVVVGQQVSGSCLFSRNAISDE